MFQDFTNKVVIVTGASQGIGAGVAKQFAKNGAKVVLVARTLQKLEPVRNEIGAVCNAEMFLCPADVSRMDEIVALRDQVLQQYGTVDVIVNCAGVTMKKQIVDMSVEEWDTVIDTNLKSVFMMAKVFGRDLFRDSDTDAGKFIAIGSVGSTLSIPSSGAYCASKGGLVQLVKVLANEWAEYRVHVNAICPGYIATPLSDGVLNVPGVMKRVISRIPVGAIGSVEDIAHATLFLSSQEANYITGICLPVDGGFTSAAYTTHN